jgi:hypothetical protein
MRVPVPVLSTLNTGAIMHSLPIICVAAALLAFPAHATSSSPLPGFAATAEQLHNIEGTYKLSNGRTLRLSAMDNRLYADLKGYYNTELVAVAENLFTSEDGEISVTIAPENSQDPLTISFNAGSRAPLATGMSERERRLLPGLR